jgi:hypothetical protein
MVNATFDADTLNRIAELREIGRRAVDRAKEDSRHLGVPNVYSVGGVLYWELPNGELSRTDPYTSPASPR